MAYNSAIPKAKDSKNKSQADLLNNFAAIQTLIDIDHVDFASGNQGKHNSVTLPLTSTSPVAPSFLATEEGLYNLSSGTTGTNEIFVHRQTVDAPTDVPFTASSLSYKTMANSSNGWTYLPSGVLLVWGRKVSGTGASVDITPQADSGCPNFNAVFRVFATPQSPSGVTFNCGASNAAAAPNANFTAYLNNPTASTAVIYFVIGV